MAHICSSTRFFGEFSLANLIERSSPSDPLYIDGGTVIDIGAPLDILNPTPCVIGLGGRRSPATFRATFDARPIGDVDTPTNFMMRIRGTTSGASTVLAATLRKDKGSATVADASSLNTGDGVIIRGDNTGDEEVNHSSGTGIVLEEICYIASKAGSVLTLGSPVGQHHGAAVGHESTVQKIVPAQPSISGVRFDGNGKKVACGLVVSRAYAPVLVELQFVDFTKAGLYLDCVKDGGCTEVEGLGKLNCLVYLRSCQWVTVGGVRTRANGVAGERHNADGLIRGLITRRHRCANVTIQNCYLCHGCMGLDLEGGSDNSVLDTVVRDMDLTDLDASTTEMIRRDGITGPARCGAGLNINSLLLPGFGGEDTDTGLDQGHDFVHNETIDGLILENCRHGDSLDQCAAMFCDTYAINVPSLSILNSGYWIATAPYANGCIFYDLFEGTIHSLTIRSYNIGIRTINGGGNCLIGTLFLGTVDGQSTAQYGFYLDDGGTSEIHVGQVFWESEDGYLLATGAAFNDSTGRALLIGRLCTGAGLPEYQNLQLARNQTGVKFSDGEIGELYTFASGGVNYRGIRVATSTSVADKATVLRDLAGSGANNWCLVASGPRRGIRVDSALTVNHGDNLIPVVGQRHATVDGTKLLPALGTSLSYRGAVSGAVQGG